MASKPTSEPVNTDFDWEPPPECKLRTVPTLWAFALSIALWFLLVLAVLAL